ncbi:hypothetical protein DLM78_09515 [Leptospira stimsonii]|uniref:Uncharacterized protein n=1 Tax=Leptospira stimsonii TaxID=2202203 RepID=A0A8B3CRJ0_9LEPT|nr:hypothetical protein DLM78_09515 [Leptospira stimsonii]
MNTISAYRSSAPQTPAENDPRKNKKRIDRQTRIRRSGFVFLKKESKSLRRSLCFRKTAFILPSEFFQQTIPISFEENPDQETEFNEKRKGRDFLIRIQILSLTKLSPDFRERIR